MRALLILLALPLFAQDDVVRLETWRVHPGDDPAWAAPGFDDSAWATTAYPTRSEGRTFQSGTRWYRTQAHLPENFPIQRLAIAIGALDEVYEVFVEGVKAGTFGQWEPQPHSSFNQHLVFPIPPDLLRERTVHIAIRRWVGGSPTHAITFDVNFARHVMHPPEIGPATLLEAREALHTATGFRMELPHFVTSILLIVAAIICLAFFHTNRQNSEYLLLGLYCLSMGAETFLLLAAGAVDRRSALPVLLYGASQLNRAIVILLLWRVSTRFRPFLLGGAVLATMVALMHGHAVAAQTSDWWLSNTLIAYVLPVFILAGVVGLLWERSAGLLLIAGSLLLTTTVRSGAWAPNPILLGNIPVRFNYITEVFFVFSTLGVLYARFRLQHQRQEVLNQDLAAARRVQEMLLGHQQAATPGYAVETAYHPAKEVGGDFYQCWPAEDGSLLLVVGDVSGKGLEAAMLVASLLGSLRNEPSCQPAQVLAHLNHALFGRTNGGFVTCCCLRLDQDGTAVLANAGHLAPYLNGNEVAHETGLPLGIVAGTEYEATTFPYGAGRLTIVSDGVVEAANGKGELFGFDRTRQISRQSAQEIAEAARAWGQNDDITVVTVRRIA